MKSDVGKMLEMLHGYRRTCLLVAAVEVGLFQELSERPLAAPELARRLALHQDSLERFLQALLALGLAEKQGQGWVASAAGRLFVNPGVGESMSAWARLIGGEYLPAWGRLSETLRTGVPAFETVAGMTVWEHRRREPAMGEAFARVGTAPQRRVLAGLIQVFDFSAVKRVVDVGGGSGGLLLGLMERFPHLEGLLFDRREVVEKVRGCAVEGGDFFKAVPAGAEVYLLKHVLHNWDDAGCLTILENCAQAMGSDGALLVMESPLGEGLEEVMMDLHMMLLQGGRERSLQEYESLFAEVGLRAVHRPTRKGCPDVLEVRAS